MLWLLVYPRCGPRRWGVSKVFSSPLINHRQKGCWWSNSCRFRCFCCVFSKGTNILHLKHRRKTHRRFILDLNNWIFAAQHLTDMVLWPQPICLSNQGGAFTNITYCPARVICLHLWTSLTHPERCAVPCWTTASGDSRLTELQSYDDNNCNDNIDNKNNNNDIIITMIIM